MLHLLGRAPSINVRKVLWTCHELGLAPQHTEWGLGPLALDTPDFLRLNPNAQVPVLVDGDFVLWESNSICRYLAAAYGQGRLLPAAPQARALVEQWMDWQATDLNGSWRYAFMALVRRSPRFADAQAVAESTAQWNRLMAVLDAQLAATGAWVAGTEFSLADVVLGLSTHRWRATLFDKPALPAVERFEAALRQREGFRRFGDNGQP